LRFRALDSWRGICALLVAAHHLEARGFIYWQPLGRNAWLFVDFFFVLSGFVIAHAYGEKLSQGPEIRSFVIRRFARLWPLHVTIQGALVAIEFSHLAISHLYPIAGDYVAFTQGRSPTAILTNIFLVQSLGLHSYETWNGPAWSISVEFFTYLLFAAVCAAAPKRSLRLLLSLVLALVGAFILARYSDFGMRETFHWSLARCVFGFFLGTLTYEAWRRGASNVVGGTGGEIVAIVLVLLFVTYVPGHAALEYLATPLFCIVVLTFAADRGLVSRALATRVPAALGRWSYSIYMVHTLVLVMAFSSVRVVETILDRHWLVLSENGHASVPATGSLIASLLYLAYLSATVALAALSWHFVELPGQKYFGNFVRPKPVIAEAVPQ
jgi:peptidoglycan/LPS O-acetylase OafA/YrhL